MASPNLIAFDARRRTPEQVRAERPAAASTVELGVYLNGKEIGRIFEGVDDMWRAAIYDPSPSAAMMNTAWLSAPDSFETSGEAVAWVKANAR